MTFDLIFVGGGLQNALGALAVLARRPSASICLIESDAQIGGNHTWCFHSADLPDALRETVAPLVDRTWPRWSVSFPELSRTFDKPYAMVTSTRLRGAVGKVFSERSTRSLRVSTKARTVGRTRVTLDDGTELNARAVVDARGPRALDVPCGYQKFVGLELELHGAHGLTAPVVIDADVPQHDGFRFFYVLPVTASRVLVEETFFSDGPELDVEASTRAVRNYAAERGFVIQSIFREEKGVLPLPLAWPPTCAPASDGPLSAGYGGGFFHPTTGYSFPIAARVAAHLANTFDGDIFGKEWARLCATHDRQARFAVLLNRLLFSATPEGSRRNVLERFHRLPVDLVERFYSLDLSASDRFRVLCGKPPRGTSIGRALKEVMS